MWPDRVSNPGPLTYESGALPIALRGPTGTEFASSTKAAKTRQGGKRLLQIHLWFPRL